MNITDPDANPTYGQSAAINAQIDAANQRAQITGSSVLQQMNDTPMKITKVDDSPVGIPDRIGPVLPPLPSDMRDGSTTSVSGGNTTLAIGKVNDSINYPGGTPGFDEAHQPVKEGGLVRSPIEISPGDPNVPIEQVKNNGDFIAPPSTPGDPNEPIKLLTLPGSSLTPNPLFDFLPGKGQIGTITDPNTGKRVPTYDDGTTVIKIDDPNMPPIKSLTPPDLSGVGPITNPIDLAPTTVTKIQDNIMNNTSYDSNLDLNHDGSVNILDLITAQKQAEPMTTQIQNSIMNSSPYDPNLDLNHDGSVNILDLTSASKTTSTIPVSTPLISSTPTSSTSVTNIVSSISKQNASSPNSTSLAKSSNLYNGIFNSVPKSNVDNNQIASQISKAPIKMSSVVIGPTISQGYQRSLISRNPQFRMAITQYR